MELKTKTQKKVPPRGFRAQFFLGDLNRRPEAPGPDLQFENSPIKPDLPAHRHTLLSNGRVGTAEKNIFGGGDYSCTKEDPKEPIFWSGQLEPTWRGAVAGVALISNIYAFRRLRVQTPPCASVSFYWFLVLGANAAAAQTDGLCAIAMEKLRVQGLAALRFFSRDFPRCVFCGLWRSASAEVKNMGFGHVAPAGPQNGLRSERRLIGHHRRSQQTHSHASSDRNLRANSA